MMQKTEQPMKAAAPAQRHDFAFLSGSRQKGTPIFDHPFALVVLNYKIDSDPIDTLWNHAAVRICADAGASRLYDWASAAKHKYVPDVVSGDFDSVRPEVLNFFKSQGTTLAKLMDDNTTDMEKCLELVVSCRAAAAAAASSAASTTNTALVSGDTTTSTIAAESKRAPQYAGIRTIVCCGAFGGRLDQVMGILNAVHKYSTHFDRIILFGDGNAAERISAGSHVLHFGGSFSSSPLHCGLIPIDGPCRDVSTRGLRWNLTNQSMRFGGLISVCNLLAEREVAVVCSEPLLWTMELPEHDRSKK